MNDIISIASGFQYSVNIGYDINNDDKLRNFIPTTFSLRLLEEIVQSTKEDSTDRARILIGAYGKGKSHIMLLILSILLKKDLSLMEKTLPKIKEDPKLYQLITNYYESQDKILPVVITGSNTSLTQAFLIALQKTLIDNDLLDVMPETNYKAAVSAIHKWKKDFPETYKQFQKLIDIPVEVFEDRIEHFDIEAYEKFEQVYPLLTSGSVFNPFLGFDVVELYESVAKSLKSRGYSGIYVVYDEFSKYLEANITQASVSDTKMLQDFAEKCARSGKLQMHIMLISHKEISNYIDKLPKQKVDGWRGVSDRFKHIHMNNGFAQTYEIISTVIQKNEPAWSDYCDVHRDDFDSLLKRYSKHPIFVGDETELNTAVIGCFPLQPVSTFILPRLSERVAQNERTLFTFLSAKGPSTLSDFLDKHDEENRFELITPDLIYDYFETSFQKEAYGGNIHSYYFLTEKILNELDAKDDLERKIIKTISLIYILELFEKLKPTIDEIVGIFSTEYRVDTIKKAIEDLEKKKFVIYIKRSNGYLRLKESSGVDVQQKIKDLVGIQTRKTSIKDTLNATNFDNYMYPSRYNDAHAMIRYFSFEFIDSAEIGNDINWEVKSEDIKADGIIYGIIPKNDEEIHDLIEEVQHSSAGYQRFIFVLPKHYFEIENVVREYQAVLTLREEAINDPVLFDEYEVIYEDLYEIIQNFINKYTHPEEFASYYIADGRILDIKRKAALTEQMSLICDHVFAQTPVINNESVNRNEITGVAENSRSKIINGLLRGSLEENLGLTGSGQDVSIMRSTLIRTGILIENDGTVMLNIHPADDRMNNMLSVIEQFILEAKKNGQISFSVLYDRLVLPTYHIGIRYGVIPIYLAAVMHDYLQQVIISNDAGRLPINADTLIQINAAPDDFTLEYLDWDPNKEEYVKRLADIFSDYIVDAEKEGNSYEYVSKAMHRWYMGLPKYAKECKKYPSGEAISKSSVGMVKLLKQNESAADLLFKSLPNGFGYSGQFSKELSDEISHAKIRYDSLLHELETYLIAYMKELFTSGHAHESLKKMTLTSVMKEWLEAQDGTIVEQLFSDGTDRFIKLVSEITNDEEMFICNAARLATGLRIEDWDARTIDLFKKNISMYKETAENYHNTHAINNFGATSSYQITFADTDGEGTTKRFDKVEISPRGKLLYNQITSALDSMGHAISEQEKRQILMDVLKKMC